MANYSKGIKLRKPTATEIIGKMYGSLNVVSDKNGHLHVKNLEQKKASIATKKVERVDIAPVKIIKEFDSKHLFGELVYFPYQWAFGISIRHLECDGMGWMFKFYFGPFKIWFSLGPNP